MTSELAHWQIMFPMKTPGPEHIFKLYYIETMQVEKRNPEKRLDFL